MLGDVVFGWLKATMVGDPSVLDTELGARYRGEAR